MYREIFPDRIKQARQEAGYTQEQVANAIGIARSNIGKYETGKLEPDLEKLAKLAQFYNVSINWMLGVTLEPTIAPQQTSRPRPYVEKTVSVQKK